MIDWGSLAQTTLRARWGDNVACQVSDTLRDQGRSRVYRLTLSGTPVSSAILKVSTGEQGSPYVVGDDAPGTPFACFCNERAGCDMLEPLGLGPRAFADSAEHGFLIMEDLGDGVSLADCLTGNDPVVSTDALFAYARSLGAMHTATQGQEARWLESRARIGGSAMPQRGYAWVQDVERLKTVLSRYSIDLSVDLDAELATIGRALEDPGEYLAFTPTDCCPDNHFLRDDRVVFFDCEWATMRHALLDAAYLLAPFPTCWCTSQLPQNLPQQLIAAYREEFPGGANFEEQLTLMLASWVIGAFVWPWMGNWQDEDREWGLVSVRQRQLHRLENLLARANLQKVLPALGLVLTQLHATLITQWSGVEPMPLYPAYQGTNK